MRVKIIFKASSAALVAALLVFTCSSCDDSFVYDNLDPCPHGLTLRFVYEYNMEYANKFPSEVDCLTLYVYDSAGNFVTNRQETSSVLADESYRMSLDLEPGDYHLVAYGGLACSAASFKVEAEPTQGTTLSSLETYLPTDGGISEKELHNFYFGELDINVTDGTPTYDEATVEMMKDTNHLLVTLGYQDGRAISSDAYNFTVTDDNTRFDCHNNIVSVGTTTYLPWAKEQVHDPDGISGAALSADLSLSRLWTGNEPRLTISSTASGAEIINIPLNDYLLLVREEQYPSMSDQEYLDRESEWELSFILNETGEWISSYIIVNGWVVRINNPSLQ